MPRLRNLLLVTVLAILPVDSALAQQDVLQEMPGLHNLVRLSAEVYSGSEPSGEEAFSSLKKLGVMTIVSVDGATPNIAFARQYGLRYVHIPFGYDAIPSFAQLSLTRAAREAKTPLYVHCHHGKHRGPAAAAIVCRAKRMVDTAGALKIMENAGTSRDYAGLWRDVEQFSVPTVDVPLPELVEVAKVESLAASMAQIDRTLDHLKLLAATNWKTPADHPDLVATHLALQLQEHLHEASRRLSEPEHANDYDTKFRDWLTESDATSQKLRTFLNDNNAAAATAVFATLQQKCRQCHIKYRDE